MIIQCPHCKNTLNLNGTMGTFTCPYCKMSSQISQSPAQPVYGGYPNQTPGTPYQPSPYQPVNQPSVYGQQSYPNQPQPVSSPYGQQPYPNQPQPQLQPQPYNPYGIGTPASMTPAPVLPAVDPITKAFQDASRGQNSISVSGLQVALQSLGINLSIEICNQLFMKYDTDRSGTIEVNEFINIEKEVQQWINVFQSLDTDHSGRMEYNEFVDAMKAIGFVISDTMLPVVFRNIDNQHNGYIDLNSFIKVVTIIQLIQIKMSAYDPNRTGSITVDLNGVLDIVMSLPL